MPVEHRVKVKVKVKSEKTGKILHEKAIENERECDTDCSSPKTRKRDSRNWRFKEELKQETQGQNTWQSQQT